MAYTSNFLTFIADPDRIEKWLFEPNYYDPATGAEGTLYFSTHPFAAGSQLYMAQLLEGLNFETAALGAAALIGAPGIADVPKAGVARLGQDGGNLDFIRDRGYEFRGRSARVLVGGYSPRLGAELAYSDYGVVRTVELGKPLVDEKDVTFQLRDKGEVLKQPLLKRRFSGSDWGIRCTSAASAYLTLGTPAALDLSGSGPLTLAASFRIKTLGAAYGILSWRKATTTAWPFAFGITTGNFPFFQYYNGSASEQTTSATAITADTTYTLAFVVVGTAVTMYLWNEHAGTETVETFTLTAAARPAHSGGELRVNFQNTFTGTDAVYDWIAVWNSEKTRDYISEIRSRQLSAAEAAKADCKLLLRMEEGSGTTTADASASAATATFSGTPTWVLSLEGGAQLEGQGKPDPWGAYIRMSPVEVWPLTRIYCVSGYKTSAVGSLHEGGNTMTAGTAYTDPETFLAASTTASRYDTLIWAGGTYVRLGSRPSLPITVSGSGCLNPAGSFVNTVDGIAKAICEARAGISSADLTGINTGSTAVVQHVFKGEVTCEDALAEIFADAGAIGWWGRQDGKIQAKVWAELATVAAVASLDTRQIESVKEIELDQPISLVTIRHSRNYTPLSIEQQSVSIDGTATQLVVATEWKSAPYPVATKANRTRVLLRDTGLTTQADAQAAAQREARLFGRNPRAYEVLADLRGLAVDFGDRIDLRYTNPGDDSYPVVRCGMGHGGAEDDGFCLSLNGTSDKVDCGSSASYALTTYTVEGWFKADPAGSGFRVLTARQSSSTNRTWWLALWDGSGGIPAGALVWKWSIGAAVGYALATPLSVVDGQWHHVACVMNGTTSASLYVDGILVASRAPGDTVDTPASQTVWLGAEGGSTRWWQGQMREWRVWSTARTPTQLWERRKRLRAIDSTTGLLLSLPLDEMRGTVAVNRGSVGGVATITGGTWAENYGTTPFWVLGAGEVSGGDRFRGRTKLTVWRGN